MKTLEEAAALFIIEDTRSLDLVVEHTERFASILDEAVESPRITAMRNAMAQDVESGRIPLYIALWSAFTHGLQIGIEMEKP